MQDLDPKEIPQRYRAYSRLTLFYPILLALALAAGIYLGGRMNTVTPGSQKETVSKLNSLLNLIEEHYVDKVDRSKLTEDAIREILDGLDPHSAYMSPEDAKQAREELSGKFGGVGIQFLVYKDTLTVTHVIPNGPSETAGIQAFDRIIEVDGKSMARKNITTEDVFDRLRGDIGTEVKLKIMRPGQRKPLAFTITRDAIPVSTVEASIMLDAQTGYIRLSQFGAQTYSDFLGAVHKLQKRGMSKLILDLRDNGGGYLDEANKIADEFLESGKLIVYTEGEHSPRQTYKSTQKGRLKDTPVAILVNHNTASASEIVSGAIQDNDRGTIIGRRSFGKGLVQQEMKPFNDGSSVRLTIARYYTPTGRCIQKPYGQGIDYEMEQVERFEHNEFFVPDSSIFVDSLKFKTPKGKIVYGGGGIMPDVFVPIDTSGRSEYYTELLYSRVYSEFAFDFVERHKPQLNRYANADAFVKSFTVEDADLNLLYALAERQGIKFRTAEANHSKGLIIQQLKAEIARLIWNADGYYSVIMQRDADVRKALEVLK
ncbi:MAG: S41 family peptidase [Flavobacteriales bacterium]|nr:S41 family peptidase [Flavobacteriales bacterium]